MNQHQLPNYLRGHRKRLALSQEEVSFLLGTQGGAKVCRYERFLREPNLGTAFAFEVIFQRPTRELFRGLYSKIERDVAARAKLLTFKKDRQKPNQRSEQRRKSLLAIVALCSKPPLNQR